jgi:cytochrome c2
VPRAGHDAKLEPHRIADGRAALALLAILAFLIAGAIATYAYQQLRQDAEQRQAAMAITGGNPERGARALVRYGCAGCHVIPGVPDATGQVGPDLGDLARRVYVAGVTTNTVDHLVAFIVDPQLTDPKSAMPRTGITLDETRDVAAYLYSIRQ